MDFNVNHPILFVIVGAIILTVLAQSVFFLIKAMKRAKEIGIASSTVKKTITSSAVFTIAPAIAVLVGVVALSKSLGIALPWLRLSVIGSITYETVAANNALTAAGVGAGSTVTDASLYVTVLWVMTLGIAIGLILVPLITKKIQGGMNKIGMKDKKWGEIFNDAMFLGMISAFLGYVFCDVSDVFKGSTAGLTPVCVMLVSAVIMAICGILSKKFKVRWLTDYALPLSLIGGMAAAIPLAEILGYEVIK
ncbi:MAG: DUF5058 family protein [Ruminococcaceae bacterium]|nr:DUF5058 family protein [Oscillospiraceae bacterium]